MPGSRVAIRTVSTFYESNQGGDRAELMLPSEVWVIEKVPLLGSGKVDVVAVGKMVEERAGAVEDTRARAAG